LRSPAPSWLGARTWCGSEAPALPNLLAPVHRHLQAGGLAAWRSTRPVTLVLCHLALRASRFQRVPHALCDHGRIVVDGECHGTFEPMGTVMRTRNPPLNGSAAIHASCGPLACLPPATTAASMRSRRLPGRPLMSKTVSGIRHHCSEHGRERALGDALVSWSSAMWATRIRTVTLTVLDAGGSVLLQPSGVYTASHARRTLYNPFTRSTIRQPKVSARIFSVWRVTLLSPRSISPMCARCNPERSANTSCDQPFCFRNARMWAPTFR
jgi:hypothetical protein